MDSFTKTSNISNFTSYPNSPKKKQLMNKSPAEIPIMVLMGIRSPFAFSFASRLCPLFLFPPLIPPATDGRERFTARGHTVVLISLSRLGGISNSFAQKHHQVPQLCLTKHREANARRTTDLCLCLSVPFFCAGIFPVLQHRNTFILENLWKKIIRQVHHEDNLSAVVWEIFIITRKCHTCLCETPIMTAPVLLLCFCLQMKHEILN